MRILHLTDTHLGAEMYALGPPGWSREQDHVAAMRAALLPAIQGLVDLVVHSGDLFNRSRPSPRAMAAASGLLREAARRVPVLVMPGNHDRRGLQRSLPMRCPGLSVVDQPSAFEHGGVRLGVLPFLRDPLRWAREARDLDAQILVAHQAFDGARVPGLVFRVGRQGDTLGEEHMPPRTRWVMCGHIHPRQLTWVGEAQVVQPGSTERTSFSEADQSKGYAIWELGREVRWRFVDLPTRPMARVSCAADLHCLEPGTLVHTTLEPAPLLRRGLHVCPRRGPHVRPSSSPQPALFA